MSSNPFITPPISPVLPAQNERSNIRNPQVNYQQSNTNQSLQPGKLAERSAIAAALSYLESPEEAELMAEQLAGRARRSRVHDGIGEPLSEPGDPLEQLLAKADTLDDSALTTLLSKFSGLENSHNPLAQLTAHDVDPGLAALMMAALLGGTENERLRRLRERFNKDNLRKNLARYLKEHGGDIAISLFSFLEFNNTQQLGTMKELYRYASGSCRTLGELFNHFKRLKDRDKRLRALLRALAFELSQVNVESNEHTRLLTVMEDLSQLVGFFSLEAICAETAIKLNRLVS